METCKEITTHPQKLQPEFRAPLRVQRLLEGFRREHAVPRTTSQPTPKRQRVCQASALVHDNDKHHPEVVVKASPGVNVELLHKPPGMRMSQATNDSAKFDLATLSSPNWYFHRNDEHHDSVTMEQTERFKTSDISGDEWRFLTTVKLQWKGRVLAETTFGNMDNALRGVDAWVTSLYDWGREGGPLELDRELRVKLCFQPKCPNDAVSTFRLKEVWNRQGCCRTDDNDWSSPQYVRYCNRHVARGDSGRTDSDGNMVLVDGPGLTTEDTTDKPISEAVLLIL